MKKAMIALGMVLIFCGVSTGWNTTRGEISGDITEEEFERLIEEDAKRNEGFNEVHVKLGQPFTVWARGVYEKEKTQFSITFDRFSVSVLAIKCRIKPSFAGPITLEEYRIQASAGKKYATIYGRVRNLGPRVTTGIGGVKAEVKVNKGYIYKTEDRNYSWRINEEYGGGSMEPGEKERKWIFWVQIPEDTTPIEFLLTFVERSYLGNVIGGTKFYLDLTRRWKSSLDEEIVLTEENEVVPTKESVVLNKEALESQVIGEYVREEPGDRRNEWHRKDGIWSFNKDGTVTYRYSGKWKIEDDKIKFYGQSEYPKMGKITSDALQCFGRIFGKNKGAKLIKTLKVSVPVVRSRRARFSSLSQLAEVVSKYRQSSTVPTTELKTVSIWSNYVSSDNKSFTLQINEDGTFSTSEQQVKGCWRWKIEGSFLKIYAIGKDGFLAGSIKGDTLIFKSKYDTLRYVRVESIGSVESAVQIAEPEPVEQSNYCTVAREDTLSSISKKYYGTVRFWKAIKQVNRDIIGGSDHLKVGWRLRIPSPHELDLETLLTKAN